MIHCQSKAVTDLTLRRSEGCSRKGRVMNLMVEDLTALESMSRSELGACVIAAGLFGDEPLLREVWKKLGQAQISLRFLESGEIQGELAEGEMFSVGVYEEEFENNWWALKPEEAQRMLCLMRDIAAGADIAGNNPWGSMLRPLWLTTTDYSTQVSVMNLPLPALAGGRVFQSGLLSALADRGKEVGGDPAWFDDVLCWASEYQLAAHKGSLFPLEGVYQVVQLSDKPDEPNKVVAYRGAVIGDDLAVDDIERVDRIRSGFRGLDRNANWIDDRLIDLFGGQRLALIAASNPDLVLCRTTVSFLRNFPWEASADAGEYDSALASYVPVHLLSLKANQAADTTFCTVVPDSQMGGAELCHIVDAAMVRPDQAISTASRGYREICAFKKIVPKTMFDRICRQLSSETRLDVMYHATTFQSLGYKSGPCEMRMSLISDVRRLKEHEFTLVDGVDLQLDITSVDTLDPEAQLKIFEGVLGCCEGELFFEGIPSSASPAEILDAYTGKELSEGQSFALTQLARKLGFQAVREAITLESHWDSALDFFGAGVVAPYIDQVQDRTATRAMIETLGM